LNYDADDKPINENNYGTRNSILKSAKGMGFWSAFQTTFPTFKIPNLIVEVPYLTWMYVKKKRNTSHVGNIHDLA
jgi:hypothetical protein